MDSFEGSNTDPFSLHKFVYAACDPIGKWDPSGHLFMDKLTELRISAQLRLNSSLKVVSVTRVARVASIAVATAGRYKRAVAVLTAIALFASKSRIEPPPPPPPDIEKEEKEDEPFVFFAHGTSVESSTNINTSGVSEKGSSEHQQHGEQRGFHVFLLGPPSNPGPGLQLAYEFGLRKVKFGSSVAVMIGSLPVSLLNELEAKQLVDHKTISGARMKETVFSPGAYPSINAYNLLRWKILEIPSPK